MPPTYRLSKSKIMSGLQCQKRLWLEVHRRELAEVSLASEHIFRMGHLFGDKSRELIGQGELVGYEKDIGKALEETPAALARASARGTAVYEAAFAYKDVVARADGFARYLDGWHMTEVKAATSEKAYFYQDCAVQAWVAEGAGYPVRKVTLAHINSGYVYPGGDDYTGMLRLVDATPEVARLKVSVGGIVGQLRSMLAQAEPEIRTGGHCTSPYDCHFLGHCRDQEPPGPEYPVEVFGHFTAGRLRQDGLVDALQVAEAKLDGVREQRILRATREQKAHFEPAARQFLASRPYPRYFLDFETVASSVPLWVGTRPYQQIPFQWSCHTQTKPGALAHSQFLDVSGYLPVKAFVRTLVEALGSEGPIVVYSGFERSRLKELCELVPEYRTELSAIMARLVDLLPVVRSGYYHPAMKGSFSIKQVAPTVCPELDYSSLGEVADGSAAQRGWWEASTSATDAARRKQLVADMLQYCRRDTLCMVAVFRALELGRAVRHEELGEVHQPPVASTVEVSGALAVRGGV